MRSAGRHGGHVLLVTLFVIVVLSAAMALLAATLRHRSWLLQQEERAVRLTALTDAALALALARLSVSSGYPGTPAEPFAEGTLAIQVEALAYPRVEVTVEATYRGGVRRARAEVVLDSLRPPRVVRWEPVALSPD